MNRAPLALMACLARLMRWAIVAAGTTNAAAICAVLSPPTARSVSATWLGSDSAGWQHRNSRARPSSVAGAASGGSGASEYLRGQLAEQVLEARVAHPPADSCRIGHSSTGSVSANGMSAAICSARSSVSQSSSQKLARYSLVSR